MPIVGPNQPASQVVPGIPGTTPPPRTNRRLLVTVIVGSVVVVLAVLALIVVAVVGGTKQSSSEVSDEPVPVAAATGSAPAGGKAPAVAHRVTPAAPAGKAVAIANGVYVASGGAIGGGNARTAFSIEIREVGGAQRLKAIDGSNVRTKMCSGDNAGRVSNGVGLSDSPDAARDSSVRGGVLRARLQSGSLTAKGLSGGRIYATYDLHFDPRVCPAHFTFIARLVEHSSATQTP